MRIFGARQIRIGGMIFAGACLAAGPAAQRATARATPRTTARTTDARQGAQIVVDETGRRVAVPAEVRRIVSLAPNLTETIYALGAESRLAGDTDYCDVPAAARAKPHVGSPLSPSLEAIVGLKPDLVLVTTTINRRETVDALERLGVPVYSTDPHSVEGLLAGIEHLASVIGIPQQGHELAASLKSRLDALEKALAEQPRCRVLFVVWDDPLISIGPKTFIADALRYAGAESVVNSKQDWPPVSFEAVVHMRPEMLIFAGDHGQGAPELADLRARAGWRDLDAVKRDHIAVISGEVDRPAPGLIDAIEDLARQLHPSAFVKSAVRSAH